MVLPGGFSFIFSEAVAPFGGSFDRALKNHTLKRGTEIFSFSLGHIKSSENIALGETSSLFFAEQF